MAGAGISSFKLNALTARNELPLAQMGVPRGRRYMAEVTCLGGFALIDDAVTDLFVSQYDRRAPYSRVQADAYVFDW